MIHDLEHGTKEYTAKLQSARLQYNKKFPDRAIDSIDILKSNYGANRGISSQKDGRVWNRINAEIFKIFDSFEVEDNFDKFDSNMSLQTDGNTLQRITKERRWYTGFGTEIVRRGQIRTWKMNVVKQDNFTGFHAYIGLCDVTKCHSKIEGPYTEYALSMDTGNKCAGTRVGKAYAEPGKRNQIVQMTLDMTGKKGTLKYQIDRKNYGVAFDNIDLNKCYKLCISMEKKSSFELLA